MSEKQAYRYLVFDSDACGYYLHELEKGRWLVEYADRTYRRGRPALRFSAEDEDDVMKVIRETDEAFLSRVLVPPQVLKNLADRKKTSVYSVGRLGASRLDRLVFEAKKRGLCVSMARGTESGDGALMFLKSDSAEIRGALLDTAVWECSPAGRKSAICSKTRTNTAGRVAANAAAGKVTKVVVPEMKKCLTVDRRGITVAGYTGENPEYVSADMTTQAGLTELLKRIPCDCLSFSFDETDDTGSVSLAERADVLMRDTLEENGFLSGRTVLLSAVCLEAFEKLYPGSNDIRSILGEEFVAGIFCSDLDDGFKARAVHSASYLKCLDREEVLKSLREVYGRYSDMKKSVFRLYGPEDRTRGEMPEPEKPRER